MESTNNDSWDPLRLCAALAALSYPPFMHYKQARKEDHDPTVVQFFMLAADDMEVRILESMPRVILG